MHSLHLRVSSSAVADHRMAEVDRDLWVPLGPPLLKQRHLEQVDAHILQEETLQTLGSLWHCLSPAQSHSCSTLGTVQLLLLWQWPRCQYHFFKISLGNSAHCILTFITLTVQSCSIHLDTKFFPLKLVLAKHALLCWIIGSNDLRNIGSFL